MCVCVRVCVRVRVYVSVCFLEGGSTFSKPHPERIVIAEYFY